MNSSIAVSYTHLVKIDLGNGNTFEIKANNASEENKNVQSARLNGEVLNQPWFQHSDIAQRCV